MKPAHSVQSDGVTVWVIGAKGDTLARFGRMGIDVHQTHEAQLAGAPECLHCTHSPTNPADWETFKASVAKHHGIEVGDNHKPQRFTGDPQ